MGAALKLANTPKLTGIDGEKSKPLNWRRVLIAAAIAKREQRRKLERVLYYEPAIFGVTREVSAVGVTIRYPDSVLGCTMHLCPYVEPAPAKRRPADDDTYEPLPTTGTVAEPDEGVELGLVVRRVDDDPELAAYLDSVAQCMRVVLGTPTAIAGIVLDDLHESINNAKADAERARYAGNFEALKRANAAVSTARGLKKKHEVENEVPHVHALADERERLALGLARAVEAYERGEDNVDVVRRHAESLYDFTMRVFESGHAHMRDVPRVLAPAVAEPRIQSKPIDSDFGGGQLAVVYNAMNSHSQLSKAMKRWANDDLMPDVHLEVAERRARGDQGTAAELSIKCGDTIRKRRERRQDALDRPGRCEYREIDRDDEPGFEPNDGLETGLSLSPVSADRFMRFELGRAA